MDYAKISKDTINNLYKTYSSLENSPLSKELRALIELRVSSINGCSYCCNLHKNEAIKLGVADAKITSSMDEDNSIDLAHFTAAEKEALDWAELLTKFSDKSLPKPRVENTNLALYFSEREIVDITICISLMNGFNRLAVSMGKAV